MPIIIEDGVTVGAGAVIAAGVRLGKRCTIGEGAVVLHDVPAGSHIVPKVSECVCHRSICKKCQSTKRQNEADMEKTIDLIGEKVVEKLKHD